ncbi:MAG: helix-turn-helix transcriptional regulator [Opitutaceae bacterium]|nr:helix-turn-helix transcriptional regulator [Opitutaceae bacterium]
MLAKRSRFLYFDNLSLLRFYALPLAQAADLPQPESPPRKALHRDAREANAHRCGSVNRPARSFRERPTTRWIWRMGQRPPLGLGRLPRMGRGTVLATHQPAQTRLGVLGGLLWVLCVGEPVIAYFDQIVACFGRTHQLPPTSEPVKRAEELVRLVRANRPRSPFFWSEQCYLWLSAYHRHLDTHKMSLQKVVTLPEQTFRLLPGLPRTVKSFAVQLGYSPAHFSRQLAKKWKKPPGRLLRELRLREASRLLLDSSDRVQDIASKTGYLSVPAFITAFKRHYGKTPLEYRHAKR